MKHRNKKRKIKKRKGKGKGKRNNKHPEDHKMCLTKGQLYNIVEAAEHKKDACPHAVDFVKGLKHEMKETEKRDE